MNDDYSLNRSECLPSGIQAGDCIKKWSSKIESETFVLETPESSPFPEAALPIEARQLVDEVVRTTFVDRNLACIQLLPWMASALGKGAVAQMGSRLTFGNLFVLGFAESGSGKSESSKVLRRPFDEFARGLRSDWMEQVRPRIEAELRHIDKELRAFDKAPKKSDPSGDQLDRIAGLIRKKNQLSRQLTPPTLLFEDATQEAMISDCASYDESMMAFSSDAGKAISNLHGRYSPKGSGAILREDTFYLKSYSCEQINVDRVTSSIMLTEPCLTLMWLVQPGKVPLLFGDESLCDGGLIPRFMPYLATSGLPETSVQPPIEAKVIQEWQCLISKLFGLREKFGAVGGKKRLVFTVEDAAAEAWSTRDNSNRSKTRGGPFRDIASFVSRWSEWALRIAVGLQAAKFVNDSSATIITLATMNEALLVAEWHANEQLRLLHQGRLSARQKEVETLNGQLERLTKELQKNGGFRTLADLQRRNNFSREEIYRLVQHAPGVLSIEDRPSATKPSRVCVLLTHPT